MLLPSSGSQQMQNLPTAQLLSTMLLPSSGSQQMQNLPSECISRTSGSSSDAPSLMSGSVLQTSHMRLSATTSTPSCTSPNTDDWFSATVTSSTRSASVIVPQPLNKVFKTDLRSALEHFWSSTSSRLSYESFATASV